MAFAPDGRLLHANENELHVLDQITGVATVVVPMTYPFPRGDFPRISSMDFQPDTGELFGFLKVDVETDVGTVVGSFLVKVDAISGVVTIVGARTVDGLDAIAWGPAR